MPEKTIWVEDNKVYIIDQTLLPVEHRVIEITSVGAMWEAIKTLRVRGAPAIGIAAALGVWLAVRESRESDSLPLLAGVQNACKYLATSRPTAVNLFWALERMESLAKQNAKLPHEQLKRLILREGLSMIDEDNQICLEIGRHGAGLLKSGMRVLTHCNAGGLATAQYGTALSVVYYACEREGKKIEVYADETRPLLQGARLTAWELMEARIPVTLICDNMAACVMRSRAIDAVIVGTDRVAANGDVANKIGTYGVAILAKHHGIPFYVAAPLSSIDISLDSGEKIPIEERNPEEITTFAGSRTAPSGVKVFNPAFDVTPNELVTALITEKGIVRPPYDQTIRELFEKPEAAACRQ